MNASSKNRVGATFYVSEKINIEVYYSIKNNHKLEKSLTWYVASHTPPVLCSINDVIIVLFLELTGCVRCPRPGPQPRVEQRVSVQPCAAVWFARLFLGLCNDAAMPKERTSTRKERREEQSRHYLQGRAKKPHVHTRSMDAALAEASSRDEAVEGVCKRCRPVLSRYVIDFNELTHHGSALKRRQHINPAPRKPDTQHYRDVKKQNEWLRENMFDALGNYLYCSPCICNAFGISSQRLARQRNVKRKLASQPVIEMKKSDVEEQSLGEYVLMPDACDLSFMVWWRSLESDTMVEVRYPAYGLGPYVQQLHST